MKNLKIKKEKYKKSLFKSNNYLNSGLNSCELLTENFNIKQKKENSNYYNNNKDNNDQKDLNKEYIDKKLNKEFPLILINANNIDDYNPIKSNYILNNYNYDEAIIYDERSFLRILFIYLISKDNILNIIYFNPP